MRSPYRLLSATQLVLTLLVAPVLPGCGGIEDEPACLSHLWITNWSEHKTYAPGDYTVYDHDEYRAVAETRAVPGTSADWEYQGPLCRAPFSRPYNYNS